MNRPLTIGTLFGSDLRLHWSWLLFPIGVAAYSFALLPWQEATFDLLLLFSVYWCVAIHEGTQFLAARHFGLGTRDVTLYPFWGIARLERMSDRPRRERFVAATGPAALAILTMLVASAVTFAGGSLGFPDRFDEATTAHFLVRLFWALVLVTALHALPLLPLDGGRIVRASLAMRMPRLRATEITARATTVGAGVMIVAAMLWFKSPTLGAAAAFLFLGAQEELGTTRYFERLRRMPAKSRPSALAPIDHIVTPNCRPNEPNFSGFTWNADARLWIEWRNGQAIAANALIGDGRP